MLAAVVALLTLVTGTPLSASGRSSDAGVPTIVVSPGNLHEGDELAVTGSGFVGTEYGWLLICPSGTVDRTACDDGPNSFVDFQVDGSFESRFEAWVMLSARDGTVTDCRVADACEAVLFSAASSTSAVLARATIDFDPEGPLSAPPSLAATPSTDLLDGSVVRATGSFPLSNWVRFDLCSPVLAGRDCRNLGWGDVDGTFAQDVTVFAVIDAWDDDLGVYRHFDCRTTTDPCQLVGSGEHGRVAVADLQFDSAGELLPPPALMVEPAVDLVDGQRTQVSGTSFAGAEFITIQECVPSAMGGACRSVGEGDVAADGSFVTDVVVKAQLSYWDDADEQQSFDCRTSVDPCQIMVQAGYGRVALADLHFDPEGELLPPPTLTVEPASAIVDGSDISIHGATFTPGGFINVDLCQVGVADRCDPSASQWLQANDDGTFEAAITAYGSFEMADGSVDCRTAPGCEVVAYDQELDLTARKPLSFAPAPPSRGRYLDPDFSDVEVIHDVVYRTTTDVNGNTVDLMIDIYQPAGDTLEKRPAIMWMHGGWFIFGDRAQLAAYAQDSARRGYVGIALQYRLRPDISSSDLPSVIEAANDAYDDATAAVEWLQANAAQYRIDPEAIIAGGYSAGATLAWNLAYQPGERGPAHPLVAAAVPISGFPFAEATAGDPPVISFHATDDSVLPPGTARDTCARARLVQDICEWHEYATGDHYVVQSQFRDITRRTYDFLAEQVLKPLGYLTAPPNPSVPITSPSTVATVTTSAPVTVTTTPPSTGTSSTSPVGSRPSTSVDAAPTKPTSGGPSSNDPGTTRPAGSARPARPVAAQPSYTG